MTDARNKILDAMLQIEFPELHQNRNNIGSITNARPLGALFGLGTGGDTP